MSQLLALLQSQPGALYGLYDAARDPDVLTLLYSSSESRLRSLYQGDSEATLGPKGPYLADLGEGSPLLRATLRRGWGKAWGLFLTAPVGFDELRKHLRTLLMVRRQKDGSELYFRFYDPRVLRVFLPTCTPEQLELVFGPVGAFLVESADGKALLRFAREGGSLKTEQLSLARSAHA